MKVLYLLSEVFTFEKEVIFNDPPASLHGSLESEFSEIEVELQPEFDKLDLRMFTLPLPPIYPFVDDADNLQLICAANDYNL